MDIKPIRTDEDHIAALREIDRLFSSRPGTEDGDRLDILTTLVEKYEAAHFPIPDADPVDAIHYYMESRGLTRRDLQSLIGRSNRISEVLNRKRPLSLAMIRNLHKGLGIPAEILIRPVNR